MKTVEIVWTNFQKQNSIVKANSIDSALEQLGYKKEAVLALVASYRIY